MPSDQFDVIVVGAGPAGTAAATLLAKSDLSVLLLEKSEFPRDKICGDCVNPYAWNFLELLGVAGQVRSLPIQPIHTVSVSSDQGKTIRIPVHSHQSTPFFAVKRSLLDCVLLDNAQSAGVVILQNAVVTDCRQSEVLNTTVRIGGTSTQFRAKYLIGADGRNSVVARLLGSRRSSTGSHHGQARVGIQWHAAIHSNTSDGVNLYMFNEGYFGIVRVDQCLSNIAMVTSPAVAGLVVKDFPTFLKASILKHPSFHAPMDELLPTESIATTYPINPERRSPSVTGVFFAGDAHRTVEPFTGEGVCLALQDGVETAKKVLSSKGMKPSWDELPKRSVFWANAVMGNLLRTRRTRNFSVSLSSRIPSLAAIVARSVFRPEMN